MTKWSSSDGVQARILDAALIAFQQRGYSNCKLTDIVQLADISIGSIYHHFGGKEDLFVICFQRLRDDLRSAVGINPDDGMPAHGSWESGYLWAVWEKRDACVVFLGADAPSGFEPGGKVAEYYSDLGAHAARIMGSMVLEAMRILCGCAREEAGPVIDSTVKLLNVIRAVGF